MKGLVFPAQGVADQVNSDWKAIRTAHTDEDFGNIFYSEIQEVKTLTFWVGSSRVF